MADGTGTRPVPVDRAARARAELVASRRELSGALTRQVDFMVTQLNMTPEEAAAWVRSDGGIPPDEREPDQVSWFELAKLLETEPERGAALWERIVAQAAEEQDTGVRLARAIEPGSGRDRPMDRARLVAVQRALHTALAPRDAFEALLVQQMACAHEMWMTWQGEAARRLQAEEWQGERDRRRILDTMSAREREQHEAFSGYLPPRMSTGQATELAVMIADRYQRAFLRLHKTLRDTRRLVGTLVVAGGQVNIGERQVNVAD